MSPARTLILILLITLLAASCANLPPISESASFRYNHSMEAFEFSPNCPKGCLLGINPGVTTAAEALHILQTSPDIDQSKIYILYADGMELEKNVNNTSLRLLEHGGTLEAPWAPTNDKRLAFYLGIGATKGIVDGLSASPIATTIEDFVSLIGEPDKIKVVGEHPADAPYFVTTYVYYSKWKFQMINLFWCTMDGPKLADKVDYVVLNQEITAADFMDWKGFGKMRLYMPPDVLRDYELYGPHNSSGGQ